ncbi:protein ASPARTIC PROTEASE IN GUARD CELL 1 [Gossypium hirsutum]|uniref:Protein ASPARTIC PROTEASE IN GUARD CELL 1 n=1 Tax=Gossypium hirsutum TaxID=3635 RepID=A0A1U8P957_GOSHI|nr:protein ASPARTIC PROTEASE IN GUARD CELL 1-like [Gossypium hirsutum]
MVEYVASTVVESVKNQIQDKQAKIKTKFQVLLENYQSLNVQVIRAWQCSSLDVSSCDSGKCLHHVLYGDGSYTMGEFVTEMLSFGNSSEVNNIALGCGQYNTGLFAGAAGLLGLDGGSFSLTSQIKATSFSYCLVDRDSASSSTLDFNSGLPADSVIASLIRNQKVDTFSYVRLTDFSVGGQPVQLPLGLFDMDDSGNGGVMLDSEI